MQCHAISQLGIAGNHRVEFAFCEVHHTLLGFLLVTLRLWWLMLGRLLGADRRGRG